MSRPHPLSGCILGCVLWLVCADLVRAEEPARAFLEALRERGYYELALDYLDQMASSPLAPAELQEVLLYERGVTLIEWARTERNAAERQRQLDQAQTYLEQFLADKASHPRASAARSQLGNLLVERGRLIAQRGKTQQDQTQLNEALQLYERAHQVFIKSQEELREKLEQMKGILDPQQQADEIALRDRLRADYLETQLLSAAVLEEMADVVEPGSARQQELLTQAAAQYGTIYEKYRTRLAGLYARLYQGRANQKLGKLAEALALYNELLDQPDSPPFRKLKAQALHLAMQCWLDDSIKSYVEAIEKTAPWVEQAGADERTDPDWLKLQFELARAYMLRASQLQEADRGSREARRALSEAKRLATFVARHPGDVQEKAQQLLVELGGPTRTAQAELPKTFEAAKSAAQEALDARQSATLVLETVGQQLETEQDEQARAELQRSLDQARETLRSSENEAIEYFRLALELAGQQEPEGAAEPIDPEELNIARYSLAFLYFKQDDFYNAAVIGEFVARRFPDSSVARQCAEIALASYIRLYNDQTEARSFESRHAMALADYILQTWPAEPQAQAAMNTLISFTIQQEEYEKTLQYLGQLPADSAVRAESELKTGRAMWSHYLQAMQELRQQEEAGAGEGTDLQRRQEELALLKARAQEVLQEGLGRLSAETAINEHAAKAALALAQILIDAEKPQDAIALLEDQRLGPLALVRQEHDAASEQSFRLDTYKTALRAYISALPTADNPDALIARAEELMDAMKQTVGETAEGQKLLIAIYISFARDLQQQIESAPPGARHAMAKGFETFLTRVGRSSEELNVLNWVAETFYAMGESYSSDPSKISPEANTYYRQALDAYQQILELARQKEGWLDQQMEVQVKLRLAMTQRQLGRFKEAMNLFEQLLQENNMLLNVQIEAAKTYQAWAAENAALYERAVMGGRPNEETKRYTIWGWGRISQMTASRPQFEDQFFESRYNLALCRYRQAQAEQSASEKNKYLEAAKKDIQVTLKLYPKLGGAQWQRQYDALLRTIQRELGERPLGLAALQNSSPKVP